MCGSVCLDIESPDRHVSPSSVSSERITLQLYPTLSSHFFFFSVFAADCVIFSSVMRSGWLPCCSWLLAVCNIQCIIQCNEELFYNIRSGVTCCNAVRLHYD